jgi:hypothetical protein
MEFVECSLTWPGQYRQVAANCSYVVVKCVKRDPSGIEEPVKRKRGAKRGLATDNEVAAVFDGPIRGTSEIQVRAEHD